MSGKKFFDINRVQIASPCSMNWSDMKGDNRKRHCRACRMNVYSVAGLSTQEALDLIRQADGGARVCLRLTRRADVTLLKRDCPVGVKLQEQMRRRALAQVTKPELMGAVAPAADREMGEIAVTPSPTPAPSPTAKK